MKENIYIFDWASELLETKHYAKQQNIELLIHS